ncbi:MAG: hypothetical protein KGJ61_08380, partial [Candidatus Omnitrophica bacterium]|nr:hypothetical protein [Candidatus Omnitrophota bacterium]
MNYSKNILGEKISYQESAKALIISRELTIDEVLKSIKECQYSSIVDRLRKLLNNNEEQKYRDEKKNLPAVCFCGTFNKSRSKENLKQYNNLIVIDLDKLNSEEMQRLKSCFEADDYIYSFWLSPSGKGFKGLVALDYKFNISQYDIHECHRAAFVKLSQYFFEKYSVELDQQCKDIPRLCFVSADRELHLKQKIEYFPVLESDLAKKVDNSTQKKQGAVRRHHVKRTTQGVTISPDVLLNPSGKNSPQDRYRIQSIIKYLSKRK